MWFNPSEANPSKAPGARFSSSSFFRHRCEFLCCLQARESCWTRRSLGCSLARQPTHAIATQNRLTPYARSLLARSPCHRTFKSFSSPNARDFKLHKLQAPNRSRRSTDTHTRAARLARRNGEKELRERTTRIRSCSFTRSLSRVPPNSTRSLGSIGSPSQGAALCSQPAFPEFSRNQARPEFLLAFETRRRHRRAESSRRALEDLQEHQ